MLGMSLKEFISAVCDLTGITEAEIKDISQLYAYDAFVVRTYNWQSFTLTGLEMFNWHRKSKHPRYRKFGYNSKKAYAELLYDRRSPGTDLSLTKSPSTKAVKRVVSF